MLFRNRAIISLETVDSTNNYAANLIKLSPPPEGTVITAQYQSQGRGQRNAAWESAENENLLCSFVLYPTFLKAEDNFYLSKIIALAIQNTLENHLQTDVFIKWPNDIIVKHKKIAGVLMETSWNDGLLNSAIAGIGINLNQTEFAHNTAISAKMVSGKNHDRFKFLEDLSSQIEKFYLKLKTGRYQEISEAYRAQLYLLDQTATYISDEKEFKGICRGVDTIGRLRIELENGVIQAFDLKAIGLRYP